MTAPGQYKGFAYINAERERMTLMPGSDTHKYHTGDHGPQDLTTGFYEVQYRVTDREDKWREMYFLNKAVPTTPSDGRVIAALVEEITNWHERILDRFDLDNEPAESILDRLTNRDWLEEIYGIGPSRSEGLKEKFERICPQELEVFSAYRQHGLPYRQGTERERWATAFFSEYDDELEEFRANPYHLLKITGEGRRQRNLARERPELVPTRYPLDWIDSYVAEDWEHTPERARAFFQQALKRIQDNGHTVAYPEQIASQIRSLGLDRIETTDGETLPMNASTVDTLEQDLDNTCRVQFTGTNADRETGITTGVLRAKAKVVGEQFRWLERKPPMLGELARDRAIERALNAHDFELDQKQKMAVEYGFNSPVSMITGPAGSGKTSTVQSILSGASILLREKTNYMATGQPKEVTRTACNLYVLAPTGKAAQRARDGLHLTDPQTGEELPLRSVDQDRMPEGGRHISRGELQVGTLHSFLGWHGSWCDIPDPHPSFIVVDESSMCDLLIMFWFTRYVQNCMENEIPITVIMTGDVEQLEPVDAGHPYRDLLGRTGNSKVPATRLDQIHRQGQGSAIIEASRRILKGEDPPLPQEIANGDWKPDFFWHDYPVAEGEEIDIVRYLSGVQERAERRLDREVDQDEIQLIMPLRNPSEVDPSEPHVRGVNNTLQNHFSNLRGNPIQTITACSPDSPESPYGAQFAVGDRVTHVGRNRYVGTDADHEPIMRGTIGRIQRIDQAIHVEYPKTDRLVPYRKPEEVHGLELAYALTGHTAQGSGFEITAILLPRRAAPTLMMRPWLYTAITRGEEFVDLMATQQRVRKCATNDSVSARQTILSRFSY